MGKAALFQSANTFNERILTFHVRLISVSASGTKTGMTDVRH
jgi:hypothetical protein